MPFYTFRNKTTDETFVRMMKISEMESYIQSDNDIEVVIAPVQTVDPYSVGLKKTDSKHRENMAMIKAKNSGTNIRTGNITEI